MLAAPRGALGNHANGAAVSERPVPAGVRVQLHAPRNTRVVYVVVDRFGFVKIGSSHNLRPRLKKLAYSTGGPVRLVGVGAGGYVREWHLHELLRPWVAHRPEFLDGRRLTGNDHEWYWNTPEFRRALSRSLGVAIDALGYGREQTAGRSTSGWPQTSIKP